jgi:hypothetical protein
MSVTPRRLLALTAAATAAALLLTGGPAAAVPAPATTTDPAAAAAGWLAQQFVGKDADHLVLTYGGQTFADYGGTADAIFALAAAKSGKSTIGAALSYLERNADTYADISNRDGYGPYDGSLGKLALAAEVAGADPTDFDGHNLLQLLQQDECPADATTCTPGAGRNIYSSVSESLIILAEARGGGSYAPSDAAVTYFLSLQCPNGGFTDTTNACTAGKDASVDETGYAVAALLALGGHEEEVRKAVTWLKGQRKADGYWVVQGGPDVDSTGLAASALNAAGVNTATSRRWLASQQVTTGPTIGAGASRGALKYQGKFDAATSVKATADGLLGMVPGASLATLTARGAKAGTSVLTLAPATVKHTSVKQGGTQTVTGTGFSSGEHVSGVLHSTPVSLGSGTAGPTGSVAVTFTVPASLDPGQHTVTLTGRHSGLSSSVTFTVTATAPTAPPTSTPTTSPTTPTPILADTGTPQSQVLAESLIGLGLLLAGAAVAYAGRRRRA